MTAIAQPLVQTPPSKTTRNAIYLLIGLIAANALAWLWAFMSLVPTRY